MAKGNQTIFITGKLAEMFSGIENEYRKQEKTIADFLQGQRKPVNDLWVAASTQAIGKIAKSIENNDLPVTRSLLLKYIAQQLSWLAILEDNSAEEVTISTNTIHNPSFNTILIKLVGELSREVLRNKNTAVKEKLATFRSFCDQWLDRLSSTDSDLIQKKVFSTEIVDKYWISGELKLEELQELFSEMESEH